MVPTLIPYTPATLVAALPASRLTTACSGRLRAPPLMLSVRPTLWTGRDDASGCGDPRRSDPSSLLGRVLAWALGTRGAGGCLGGRRRSPSDSRRSQHLGDRPSPDRWIQLGSSAGSWRTRSSRRRKSGLQWRSLVRRPGARASTPWNNSISSSRAPSATFARGALRAAGFRVLGVHSVLRHASARPVPCGPDRSSRRRHCRRREGRPNNEMKLTRAAWLTDGRPRQLILISVRPTGT